MAQRSRGNMWCQRCGPVLGVKNTHKVRNSGALVGEALLPGLGLLAGKVEPYYCPNCGARVHSRTWHDVKEANAQPRKGAPRQLSVGPATATLTSAGVRKIAVIKVIREFTGLGLREAKEAVDRSPTDVLVDVSTADAESLKARVEAAGGAVEVNVETEPEAPAPVLEAEPALSNGLVSDLERLAVLHQSGALTDDEFAEAKRQALSGHR